ncbi:hypothetical protein [Streptomyces tendae]|uniref:Uncharacterized protein n=1 Tax=Streptomyces tendae TaxID=1932 RepID=A0A6B3QXQ9_STRTE|nr:hypothetical protein [Streptomyces tendae]NEV92522.1 hypothetical protein [Streptomyces tendae]
MSDWPILVTAGLGVAGTLAASYLGIHGIRRQTTDQAEIEHGQWLRNQRQEAYVQFLEAWDQAVGKLETLVEDWDIIEREMDAHGQSDEFEEAIHRRTAAAQETAARPLERVSLLGSEQVDAAVTRMDLVFDDAQAWLNEQAAPSSGAWDAERWTNCLSRLHRARFDFTTAARVVIRSAPRPGR